MIDWLIIGGGIHGTYLANLLTRVPGANPEQIRILDPQPELLATWRRNTGNCGMGFLRSPATHNIDLPILALYRFAQTPEGRPHAAFIPPYNRPSRALFAHHCRRVIADRGLDQLHVPARAQQIHPDDRHLVVATDGATLRTRRVLLAIGLGEQPCWPAWAQRLRQGGASVAHVFDHDFARTGWPPARHCIVVGGGITAVQTALRILSHTSARVHLLSRHALRESQYDFDPCWIGPKCLRAFHRASMRRRRARIDGARISGSLPAEVLSAFNAARRDSRLGFSQGRCLGAATVNGRIELATEAGPLAADQVILATGFETRRPGGPFVDRLIRDFNLPLNRCGYPSVKPDLRWDRRIYVTGPLAELQLGPCARNIVGARNAGRLLLQGLGLDSRTPPH
jgi:cation diffusion facilitator CzcD-associated flavoprotein CzcO